MNSQEYWDEREELHIREMIGKEAKYDSDIEAMYVRHYREIEKEINAFYTKYVTDEGLTLSECKKKVSKLDIEAYQKKAAEYVRTKDFSDQANAEMKLYNLTMKVNRLEMLKSEIGLECVALGNDVEKYVSETLTEEGMAEARRQAGILGETAEMVNVKDVEKIVKGSWSVNMESQTTFSERIWGNNESLKRNIDTLLTQSIISGKHPREMARQLQKQFGASRYEAERLMRTESARVQADVQSDSFEKAGYTQYKIIAEPTACEICKNAADGGPYRIADRKIGLNMYPFHPNCRCSSTPLANK